LKEAEWGMLGEFEQALHPGLGHKHTQTLTELGPSGDTQACINAPQKKAKKKKYLKR
jgi:hypothetical protein